MLYVVFMLWIAYSINGNRHLPIKPSIACNLWLVCYSASTCSWMARITYLYCMNDYPQDLLRSIHQNWSELRVKVAHLCSSWDTSIVCDPMEDCICQLTDVMNRCCIFGTVSSILQANSYLCWFWPCLWGMVESLCICYNVIFFTLNHDHGDSAVLIWNRLDQYFELRTPTHIVTCVSLLVSIWRWPSKSTTMKLSTSFRICLFISLMD